MEKSVAKRGYESLMPFIFVIVIASVVVLQFRWNKSLDWSQVTVSLPQYRSADGAEKPHVYTEADLAALAAEMKQSVGESYAKARPRGFRLTLKPRTEYRMETSLRELFDGGIAVELRAYTFKDHALVKEFTREYDSADAMRSGASALGTEISTELAALAK